VSRAVNEAMCDQDWLMYWIRAGAVAVDVDVDVAVPAPWLPLPTQSADRVPPLRIIKIVVGSQLN